MKSLLLAGLLPMAAGAQVWTQPPPLIRLVRRAGADAAVIRRYAETGAATFVFGMTSITGPVETWLIEAHGSFADIEQLDLALHPRGSGSAGAQPFTPIGDEILPSSSSLIAFYRPGWSYRPDEAIQAMPKARYFQVALYRITPGSEAEFGEMVRARNARLDSINLDRPEMAYQVISGAPSGTYLLLTPLPSLKTFDEAVARTPPYARGAGAASARAGAKIATEGELRHENLLFRLEPEMSWVSDEFAQTNPGFWRRASQ